VNPNIIVIERAMVTQSAHTRATAWVAEVRFLKVASNISLLHGVQIGYDAKQPFTFLYKWYRGPFLKVTWQGSDACSSSSYLEGIENGGLISPFPHTLKNDLNPNVNLQHIES
jgi:hypothetical protein